MTTTDHVSTGRRRGMVTIETPRRIRSRNQTGDVMAERYVLRGVGNSGANW